MTRQILFLILLLIISVNFSFPQDKKEETIISKAKSGACEMNSAYFDLISNEVGKSKERIFVIFRAGRSETETVNAQRLNFVKIFLQNSKRWRIFDTVYARGEKTDAVGKIEFYIGGKLFLIVMSPKNKTPCLDCCELPEDYSQNLLKKKRIRKRKS